MAIPSEAAAALEALNRLKSTNPPLWLAPSPSLSQTARTACKHIFSSINPHVPKSLFDQLLIDGFDVEQIWQQIDLQSQPLVSTLRRQVLHFEKNPKEIRVTGDKVLQGKNNGVEEKEVKKIDGVGNGDDDDMDMYEIDDEDEDDDEEEEGGEEEVSEEDESGEEEGEKGVVEDKFLKIKDLEDFLEDEDAREYGLDTKKNNKKDKLSQEDDEDEDDDEGEGGEDDEDDELGVFGDGDEEEDEDASKHAREISRKLSKASICPVAGSTSYETVASMVILIFDERKGRLSTHEKQLQKLQSEIEQMEKVNLEPKTWTMQGEVTAASRPKNSALEVDLDFEHNMRPAPVITEEVTATLEDMIKNRIIEGQFNDIQKAPSLPSKAPRELKELDDNKSKKGLADVYEEEYVQKTNPAAAPLSFSDEQKEEVIEDMSIQANVPALAMEEIAPMAVSDAAMLAPEEVFSGKGDIKEEAELTQAERKRRRANKKRKFKAESVKGTAKKARENTTLYHDDGKEE
uniref:Uncharacterized protein n=1 Tax=Populus alba TaxID=43335 RepID=A0A4V5ZZX2_POPAL|nr:hypothetical protein D5086_0000309150 [Populus alba]